MSVGSPSSSTTALRASLTSICEICAGHVAHAQRIEQPPREQRAVDVRCFVARRRRQPVDDRQIEIRVVRTVLVDDRAAVVHEIQRAVDAADAERRPLLNRHVDRRRQRPAKRRVGDPRRVQQRAAPLFEIDGQDALGRAARRAARALRRSTAGGCRARRCARTLEDLEPDERRRPRDARRRRARPRTTTAASAHASAATPARARLRAGFRCARRNRLSAGAVTGISDPTSPARSARRPADRADRSRAEQHDQIARPARVAASSRGTSSSARHRRAARRVNRRRTALGERIQRRRPRSDPRRRHRCRSARRRRPRRTRGRTRSSATACA